MSSRPTCGRDVGIAAALVIVVVAHIFLTIGAVLSLFAAIGTVTLSHTPTLDLLIPSLRIVGWLVSCASVIVGLRGWLRPPDSRGAPIRAALLAQGIATSLQAGSAALASISLGQNGAAGGQGLSPQLRAVVMSDILGSAEQFTLAVAWWVAAAGFAKRNWDEARPKRSVTVALAAIVYTVGALFGAAAATTVAASKAGTSLLPAALLAAGLTIQVLPPAILSVALLVSGWRRADNVGRRARDATIAGALAIGTGGFLVSAIGQTMSTAQLNFGDRGLFEAAIWLTVTASYVLVLAGLAGVVAFSLSIFSRDMHSAYRA